ncbi:MAG: urea carboxylase-associated family protein [Alphaproteobacteria bacterium]|nr:urea carboxylase-associated family protein [Alphaproteobacteria bacterium]
MAVTVVPARYGRAARVPRGRTIAVINTHGNQVVDTWAFAAADPAEFMCMEHTRSVNSTIYPRVGVAMMTNRRRPVLTWLEDTSPGVHDTVLCACNRQIYEELGIREYHRNCEDNLHEALAEIGMTVPFTPAPLNLFMNTPVGEDGGIVRLAPVSRPGDRVTFRAEMDAVVVFSACPQDITPINGDGRLPQDVEFLIA